MSDTGREGRMDTDAARERARRLVEAEAQVVALTAEVAFLRERLTDCEYERGLAEDVVREVQDCYPRRVFLPGDDEPHDYDGTRVTPIVVCLRTGNLFRGRWDGEWVNLSASWASIASWSEVLAEGPVIDVTGSGSERLWERIQGERNHSDTVRNLLWAFERSSLWPSLLRELDLTGDRSPAGSVAEARAILALASRVIAKLAASRRVSA